MKLSCDDHLVLFDGDLDYGQRSINDFSCRDNMASVPTLKTTGTFLTMRYSSDGSSKLNDGFRLVVTAVFDISMSDCPPEYVLCRSHLCISRSLFCDGVNHCLDDSDEIGCNGQDDAIELPYALGFFVMLILIISIGVIVCIILHCRQDQSPYDQYQHHLQRAFGVPLPASSSLMFAPNQHHQPQYQFFQPANMSPYVTPVHLPAAMANQQQQQQAASLFATLPRGYSTLPLNMVRGAGQAPQTQQIFAKAAVNTHKMSMMANHHQQQLMGGQPQEYMMMAGLNGPHLIQQPAALAMPLQAVSTTPMAHQQVQRRANLANSHSILSTETAGRQQVGAPLHQQQQQTSSTNAVTSTGPASTTTTMTSASQQKPRAGSRDRTNGGQ